MSDETVDELIELAFKCEHRRPGFMHDFGEYLERVVARLEKKRGSDGGEAEKAEQEEFRKLLNTLE